MLTSRRRFISGNALYSSSLRVLCRRRKAEKETCTLPGNKFHVGDCTGKCIIETDTELWRKVTGRVFLKVGASYLLFEQISSATEVPSLYVSHIFDCELRPFLKHKYQRRLRLNCGMPVFV